MNECVGGRWGLLPPSVGQWAQIGMETMPSVQAHRTPCTTRMCVNRSARIENSWQATAHTYMTCAHCTAGFPRPATHPAHTHARTHRVTHTYTTCYTHLHNVNAYTQFIHPAVCVCVCIYIYIYHSQFILYMIYTLYYYTSM